MAWTTSTISYDLSRPSSPSEKRKLEIPGIVLTEAPSTRTSARSPPPKQVILLNPSSIYPHRSRGLLASLGLGQTLRTVVLVLLIALAMWHLYASLQLNVAVGLHVHVPPAAMQF